MEILNGHTYQNLEVSTQILVREARRRKYNVDIISEQNNFIRIWWNDRSFLDVIEATITKHSNLLCFWKTEQKDITKMIFKQCGIPTPNYKLFYRNKPAPDLAGLNYPLVVKPTSTNFGDHVYLNLKNEGDVKKRIEMCHSVAGTVLVEEQVSGMDLRFLVIQNKVAAVASRVPATIIGNGVSSVEELIINLNKERGEDYSSLYRKIVVDDEVLYTLKCQDVSLSSVPEKNAKIALRFLPNLSKGGSSYNVTAKVPDFYKHEIEKLSYAFENDILGIDVILSDIDKPPSKSLYSVIEVNDCPMISLHMFPIIGDGVDVGKILLDYYVKKDTEAI